MNKPRVGVAVIIRRNNKVLLGLRKGSHGTDTWAFPGGALAFEESLEDCAKREVKEETCLEIKNISFATLTNDFFDEINQHWITLFMVCDYASGEAKVMEPNRCKEWGWFEWNRLPEPRFLCLQNLLKQNFNPFT